MLVRKSRDGGLAVELSDVKAALRVGHSDHDSLLEDLIRAETGRYEQFTRRVLVPTTYELLCSGWSEPVTLPANPVREVESVAYLDAEGQTATLDSGEWYLVASEGETQLHFSEDFSAPRLSTSHDRPVTITFSAGYDVPESPVSGMADYIASDRLDQRNITTLVGRIYYEDLPMPEREMRERMSGRRLLT